MYRDRPGLHNATLMQMPAAVGPALMTESVSVPVGWSSAGRRIIVVCRMHRSPKSAAALEYVGSPASTASCVRAVERLIQSRIEITFALLVTSDNHHALLLEVGSGDPVVVKAGFTSGYVGEGPRGLSRSLALLHGHGIEIDEVVVTRDLLERLNQSALTDADVQTLRSARRQRPCRWVEFTSEGDLTSGGTGALWRKAKPVIPYAIIDERVFDLARRFWEAPDERLLTGYRRLEDALRKRSGVNEHGTKLVSAVFLAAPPKLTWSGCDSGEVTGRATLFTAALLAYRNPRAHRVLVSDEGAALAEFLLLNHLFRLEREAV